MHDLDLIAFRQNTRAVVFPRNDLAIYFDGDATLIECEVVDQTGDRQPWAECLWLTIDHDLHAKKHSRSTQPLQPGNHLVSGAHSPFRMTTTLFGRPTFAAIDAAALRANFALLRALVPPSVAILAVVKADGYGHSAQLVGPILEAAGADWLGVATVEEGVELRTAGVRAPILVLTGAARSDVPGLIEQRLSVAVLHRGMVEDLAAGLGTQRLSVHVKIDTGMGRIGVLPTEVPALIAALQQTGNFDVEGIFSHFANADSVERDYSDYQLKVFRQTLEAVTAAGIRPRWIHIANSAAAASRPDAHFSLVRPGLALYGIPPAPSPAWRDLQPAMRVVTRILQIKTVPSEFPVSYGQTFVTRRPSVIAVLPIGYADGYSRALSNRAAVLIRGQRAPVVGAVCMDLTMVDVTDVAGVQVGDEVVIWGRQNGGQIGVAELADWQGSIPYEVLTRLGKRVPRVLM
jgi:alanine racemase